MNTLIAWRLSPLSALAALVLLYGLARALLWDVRRFAAQHRPPGAGGETASTAGLWLFCLAGTLVLASPAALGDRLMALLMLTLLLRLAVCDALTGLLPRRETLAFLAVGLIAESIRDPAALTGTALVSLLCILLHRLINRRRERLGRGDLFMLAGLAAWADPLTTLQTAMTACAAFILWHSTWRPGGRLEGPLGPWLSLAAAVSQLLRLYQPVWVTP